MNRRLRREFGDHRLQLGDIARLILAGQRLLRRVHVRDRHFGRAGSVTAVVDAGVHFHLPFTPAWGAGWAFGAGGRTCWSGTTCAPVAASSCSSIGPSSSSSRTSLVVIHACPVPVAPPSAICQ